MLFETIGVSTAVVAAAEIGDKTQLLAFVLAARFRRPLPIVLGILVATVFNHALAGILGVVAASFFTPDVLKWVLVVSFVAMAIWILMPDKLDDGDNGPGYLARFGVFGTTVVTFFLAEMGDKTQVATVAMAAHYGDALSVVIGTTLGMLLADVPAVFIGERLSGRIPLKWMRMLAATIFIGLAVFALLA